MSILSSALGAAGSAGGSLFSGMFGEMPEVEAEDIGALFNSMFSNVSGKYTKGKDPLEKRARQALMKYWGSDPMAKIDAMATDAYNRASGQINRQSNIGMRQSVDALIRRGIARSGETTGVMSALDQNRLNAIGRASQGIEQQRLAMQLNLPQQMMAMGSWGAGLRQQQVANQFRAMGIAGGLATGQANANMQAQAANQQAQAMQMQGLGSLAGGIGSLAGMFMGGPPGAMLGGMIGGSAFGGGIPQQSVNPSIYGGVASGLG